MDNKMVKNLKEYLTKIEAEDRKAKDEKKLTEQISPPKVPVNHQFQSMLVVDMDKNTPGFSHMGSRADMTVPQSQRID
jgi:hypothetical protein